MGARTWHIARADYHKEVADFLNADGRYKDWSIVALYYSALHFMDSVLCDEPEIPKDERHPRKHSGMEVGNRGRHQLVASYCRAANRPYRKLEQMSRRTRYDVEKLSEGGNAYDRALPWWREVERYARMMHMVREPIPTDAP